MKKKMILDVIMSTIIVLLMKTVFTGMLLHELLGLFVFALFILHKFLNWKWIKGVTPKLFSDKTPTKTKVMYAIDVLLFILVTFIIISGVLISQEILTSIQAKNLLFWSEWHHFAAYSALVLISIHIGMHWQSIMGMFKKIFKLSGENALRTLVCRILAVVIMFLGIKVLFRSDINSNFTAPFIPENNGDGSAAISDSTGYGTYTGKVYLSSTTQIVDNAPTLEEYLSKLVCTGCGRRCPLTNLGCSKGTKYKNEAIEEYNAKYTVEVTAEDSENTSEPNTSSADDSQTTSESSDVTNQNEGYSEEESTQENFPQKTTPLDFVFIMGLFVGGTHYVVSIPKYLKKQNLPDQKTMKN